jgi:hypothetical protein
VTHTMTRPRSTRLPVDAVDHPRRDRRGAGQGFTWHAATASAAAPTPGQPGGSSGHNPYQGDSADY